MCRYRTCACTYRCFYVSVATHPLASIFTIIHYLPARALRYVLHFMTAPSASTAALICVVLCPFCVSAVAPFVDPPSSTMFSWTVFMAWVAWIQRVFAYLLRCFGCGGVQRNGIGADKFTAASIISAMSSSGSTGNAMLQAMLLESDNPSLGQALAAAESDFMRHVVMADIALTGQWHSYERHRAAVAAAMTLQRALSLGAAAAASSASSSAGRRGPLSRQQQAQQQQQFGPLRLQVSPYVGATKRGGGGDGNTNPSSTSGLELQPSSSAASQLRRAGGSAAPSAAWMGGSGGGGGNFNMSNNGRAGVAGVSVASGSLSGTDDEADENGLSSAQRTANALQARIRMEGEAAAAAFMQQSSSSSATAASFGGDAITSIAAAGFGDADDAPAGYYDASRHRVLRYATPTAPGTLWLGGVSFRTLCASRRGGVAIGAMLRRILFALGRVLRRGTPPLPATGRLLLYAVTLAHLTLMLVDVSLTFVMVSELFCVEPLDDTGGGSPPPPPPQQRALLSGIDDAIAANNCNYVPLALYFALPPLSFLAAPLLGLAAVSLQSSRALRLYAVWNGSSLWSATMATALVIYNASVLGTPLIGLASGLFLTKLLSAQCVPTELAAIESHRPINGWRGLFEVRTGPRERVRRMDEQHFK